MRRFFEHLALRPDAGRALRAAIAFAVPLCLCQLLGRPAQGIFVAIAAQTFALPDLRGAYRVRLLILATMIVTVAGAAFLGVVAGGSLIAATLCMGLLALIGGGWRHLSADYGPSLSVSSALLFLLGISRPGPPSAGLELAALIALGGVGAAGMHILLWLFRPQHPLRYAVAETWVAASDLAAAIRASLTPRPATGPDAIAEAERTLRETLDRTFVILAAAGKRHPPLFLSHLEEMRREAVHFSMRLTFFHSSVEALAADPRFARELPVVDSVFKSLGDTARSVAMTLIAHRPANFAATEIRLRRAQHLIQVLDDQLAASSTDLEHGEARAALREMPPVLQRLLAHVENTTAQAGIQPSFPGSLPDLGARPIRSLAAWINPSAGIDPVLVRYSLRMALLTMAAVAVYKGFDIGRGYWIAFTIVVVLQPDYGATRERAAARIGGTLAGSLLASALLLFRLPLSVLDGCAAGLVFAFAYFLKQRYGVAVFFVTLMLVLVTETAAPVHVDFTIARLLSTLAGGLVALASAVLFWPLWEKKKFDALIADALRANRSYVQALAAFLRQPQPQTHPILLAKRRAENANRHSAASLKRLLAEPGHRSRRTERDSALATYNQRLTRALTAIAVHLEAGARTPLPGLSRDAEEIAASLETLATLIQAGNEASDRAGLLQRIAPAGSPGGSERERSGESAPSEEELIRAQFVKSAAEIRAMALALEEEGRL